MYAPSPAGTALVVMMPRSVPACASVRHIVPLQVPSTSLGRKRCLISSEPWLIIALYAPCESPGYMLNDRLDGAEHLLHDEADRFRQPLPAVRRVGHDAGPSAGGVLRVGLLESGRRPHVAVHEVHALGVARLVDREEHLLADRRALGEHGVDHVGRGVLEARERRRAGPRRARRAAGTGCRRAGPCTRAWTASSEAMVRNSGRSFKLSRRAGTGQDQIVTAASCFGRSATGRPSGLLDFGSPVRVPGGRTS